MTLVEKILKREVGETVKLRPNLYMINDGEGHKCMGLIDKTKGIPDKDKVIVVLDHDIPAGSFKSAETQKNLIEFSQLYDLKFIQSLGIGYQILSDSYVKAGDVVVSCGSHNSFFGAKHALGLGLSVEDMANLLMGESIDIKVPETVRIELKGRLPKGVYVSDFIYKLISEVGAKGFEGMLVEFTGDALKDLSLSEKTVLCSMTTQIGAVSALVNEEPSGKYSKVCEYELGKVQACITLPGDLYTTKSVEELKGVAINAGFIGGCNGGHIEDLRVAASILKGKRVKVGVRLLFGFASNDVYLQAIEEGLIQIFFDSGAQVTNPGCASCKTDSIGVVGDGEIMLTTGSHNYPGCCGTEESKVYIASAAVVASASLTGYIAV